VGTVAAVTGYLLVFPTARNLILAAALIAEQLIASRKAGAPAATR
jgi:hypothetical protein